MVPSRLLHDTAKRGITHRVAEEKLCEQMRDISLLRRLSLCTEEAYWNWTMDRQCGLSAPPVE